MAKPPSIRELVLADVAEHPASTSADIAARVVEHGKSRGSIFAELTSMTRDGVLDRQRSRPGAMYAYTLPSPKTSSTPHLEVSGPSEADPSEGGEHASVDAGGGMGGVSCSAPGPEPEEAPVPDPKTEAEKADLRDLVPEFDAQPREGTEKTEPQSATFSFDMVFADLHDREVSKLDNLLRVIEGLAAQHTAVAVPSLPRYERGLMMLGALAVQLGD